MSLKLNDSARRRIGDIANEICEREGCRLYDIEFVGGSKGKGRCLRIYIDKPDTGVSVEDCAKVSRGVGFYLDAEDQELIEGSFHLEVSSPGLERPLRETWHFESSLGEKIFVKLKESLDRFVEGAKKQTKLKGLLKKVDGEKIVLGCDGMDYLLPIQSISKAKVLVDFENALKAKS